MRIAEFAGDGLRTDRNIRRLDMEIRSTGLLAAAATLLVATTVPALVGAAELASLNDGHVHGFSGCLTQEPSGTRYFDLTDAKSDDGKVLGTVRLTSSLFGISPKDSLGQRVHVKGDYRGQLPGDPPGGHIAVQDAAMTGGKCA
jgi:hypothetical protein